MNSTSTVARLDSHREDQIKNNDIELLGLTEQSEDVDVAGEIDLTDAELDPFF